MRTFRLGGVSVLNAGTLSNAVLDLLLDAKAGCPAIVPAPLPANSGAPPSATGTGLLPFLTMGVAPGTALPSGSTTGTWSGGVTTTPNSTYSFTYVGLSAQLVLAGNPASGGIAWVTLDGAARMAMDTAISAAPQSQTILTPNGGSHTVQVAYYGDIASGVTPIGMPTNVTGTSVAPLLQPARVARGGTTTATWTIAQVTDSGHVSINGSGSYALGTTVTGVIPGVNLTLQSGTLTTGDSATFTTTATGISILALNIAVIEAANATWTSPIISADGTAIVPAMGSGQPTVIPLPLADPVANDRSPLQWCALTWEEDPNYPVQAGFAATGNTLNSDDPAWSKTPALPGFNPAALAISHDGLGHGCMGLAVLPRGTYCVVSLEIPQLGYLRNPRLYGWEPDTDPDRRRYPPVPGDDLAVRLYAALCVGWAAIERDPMRELLASTSLGTAVGALLDQHGAEWGLPRPYGMDDGPYAAALRFLSASRTRGGTLAFFDQALRLLLGPAGQFTLQPLNGTTQSWILGTSRLGIDSVLGVKVPNAWQLLLQFQVRSLSIPPQTLQAIIAPMVPACVVPIWSWI